MKIKVLMRSKELIIINPESTSAKKIIAYVRKARIDFIISERLEHLSGIINEKMKEGYGSFIVCGGDGTINNFVNSYIVLPAGLRKRIKLGVLPCGKANDLARQLSLPLDIVQAHNQLKKSRYKYVDLIKVNEKYFITGGGLGLPAEVIQDVNKFKFKLGVLNKFVKDLVYYFFVLKNVFLGYSGVSDANINSQLYKGNFMLLSVMNQEFIGKRFNLSPDANNCDGKIDLCLIPKKNGFGDFITVNKIIKKNHVNETGVISIKGKKFVIQTKQKIVFMADGEILCCSSRFKFEIIHKAIKVLY